MENTDMEFRDWDDVPEFMRNDEVKKYYKTLSEKRFSLEVKRFFDVVDRKSVV